MSTIKISQLATTNIALSDFIIKADAEGVATKNTVQGLADLITTTGGVSFKGPIAIADTPSENGWYFASESGTYTNCGGLVINTTDNIAIIIVSGTFDTFSKIDIPVNITIDAIPTNGSLNAVESDGVFDSLLLKQDNLTIPVSVNVFNKDESIIALQVGDSEIVDNYGNVVINNSASTGYNFGTWGIAYSQYGISMSHKIPLTQGNAISNRSVSSSTQVLYFNSAGETIGSVGSSVLATWFTDVSYVRFTFNTSDINALQIEYGSTSTSYEPYKEAVPKDKIQITSTYDSTNTDTPITGAGVEQAVSVLNLDGKLDKVIGNQKFNKNATSVSLESADSPYSTDVFDEDSNLTNVWLDGYNFGSWKLIYQTGSSLSQKYYITEANPKLIRTDIGSSTFKRVFYFNSSNQIINVEDNILTATWVAGVHYVRIMFAPSNIGVLMINEGETILTYEDYTENKPVTDLQAQNYADSVVNVLPNKLYFVKDYQSCLYFENIIKKNLNDAVTVFFDRGIDYNRLCQLQFSTTTTDSTIISKIRIALNEGETKIMTYDVVDSATNSGKTANVLYIGDSFTDLRTYAIETTDLLQSDGVTVNEVGTTGGSTLKSEAWSGGTILSTFLSDSLGVARLVDATPTVMPETKYNSLTGVDRQGVVYIDDNANEWIIRGGGNGKIRVTNEGAVTGDFSTFPATGDLTKKANQSSLEGDAVIAYSNPTSAFLNPFLNSSGNVDLANYATTFGLNTPDVVVFQFTFNDLQGFSTDAEIDTVVSNFQLSANKVNTEWSTTKVIFSIEPWGSPNGGQDFNGRKETVLKFVEKLIIGIEQNATYNTYCYLAPSYAFVDSVNGYSTVTATPSSRFPSITEISGGDGVHPVGEGMKQISDCVYQLISNII